MNALFESEIGTAAAAAMRGGVATGAGLGLGGRRAGGRRGCRGADSVLTGPVATCGGGVVGRVRFLNGSPRPAVGAWARNGGTGCRAARV